LSWPPLSNRKFYRLVYTRGKFPEVVNLESDGEATMLFRIDGLNMEQRVRISVCASADREACSIASNKSCTSQIDAVTTRGRARCETRYDTDTVAGAVLAGANSSPDGLLGTGLSAKECCARCASVPGSLPYRRRCEGAAWERKTGACFAKKALREDELMGRPGWDTLLLRFE